MAWDGNRNNNFNKRTEETPVIKFEFIEKGFWDAKGNIREDLITTEAENIAKSFLGDGRNKLSNSQLRAFFNEIKGLNNRLADKEKNWENVYPLVLMVKSKIEYRASKDKKMAPLKNFLLKAIGYIQKENRNGKGYEAFKTFVIFFEAIVGYSYGLGIN